MTITRNFKLCLNAGTGSAPYINVNQYDRGETWLFELYNEDGTRYTPSSGAIIGLKSDGHTIMNNGTVDSEGRVVIEETEQMTAAAGRSVFELSIDGLTHGTANFIVKAERKPFDEGAMSDSDISMLQEVIDASEVINEVIGEGGDPSQRITDAVDDWLDAHPEATTTVQDGAITAPKINTTLWDKLLVSEEASGNPASFDDGADDVPVSSLKVNLEPIQTGTGDPSPSNVRPIIAANGINIYPPSVIPVGATGYHMASYTADVTEGQTYTISVSRASADKQINYSYKNSGGTYGSDARIIAASETSGKVTLTVPSGVVGINVYSSSESTVELKVQIERGSSASPYQPYQSISVLRTGKNILPNDLTWTTGIRDDYGNHSSSAVSHYSRMFRVAPATTYTAQGLYIDSTSWRLYFSDKNGNWISRTASSASVTSSFTTPANCYYMQVQVGLNGTLTSGAQIELGSTASEYEPYIGTSYPYTLGQSVYGGTVDLATGALTVTHEYHAVSEYTNWLYSADSNFFYQAITVKKAGAVNIICDEYQTKVRGTWTSSDDCVISGNNNTSQVYIRDSRYTTVADFRANVTASICYELAEPQTIQLTPTQVKTLLGYNNISSSGTVDVIYHADTKLYIDEQTKATKNIIAGVETGFTATKNYTVGNLLIVGDDLYRVTANIANGSAITVNTNVVQTTVAEQLLALA